MKNYNPRKNTSRTYTNYRTPDWFLKAFTKTSKLKKRHKPPKKPLTQAK